MAVILVAEDEEMIRNLVKSALTSAGHDVIMAANGLEAVALYRSFPNRISLVLTDIRMPLMDGHQVIKLVRETRPDAKIICMTGYSERTPDRVHVLAKPFSMTDLRDSVERVLKMH